MDLKLENTISSGSWNAGKRTTYRSRMPKLNQVNWLIKTIQDINSQIQVARYHMQIARTRVQAWTETKNLKSSTQSNHIQIISQSQTEGLLTRHCSVLQLSPIVKSSPNIDNPIPISQTITHIIVSFVPQPTIIAINFVCMYPPAVCLYPLILSAPSPSIAVNPQPLSLTLSACPSQSLSWTLSAR